MLGQFKMLRDQADWKLVCDFPRALKMFDAEKYQVWSVEMPHYCTTGQYQPA